MMNEPPEATVTVEPPLIVSLPLEPIEKVPPGCTRMSPPLPCVAQVLRLKYAVGLTSRPALPMLNVPPL